MDWDHI
jgi:hypothetical protein